MLWMMPQTFISSISLQKTETTSKDDDNNFQRQHGDYNEDDDGSVLWCQCRNTRQTALENKVELITWILTPILSAPSELQRKPYWSNWIHD